MTEPTPNGIKIIKKSYSNSSALSLPKKEATEVHDIDDEALAASGSGSGSNSHAGSGSNAGAPSTKEETMTLTKEQKEDLIDKLETKKHKLKVAYREQPDPEIERQYREVRELLAIVKECDAVDKMQDNIKDVSKLQQEFISKFKRLAVTDFNRIIDLTGSKDGRKPDITTETWLRGRTVVFKDKGYRPPPEEKVEKFQQKMRLKPMPTELQTKMQSSMQGNLQAANIRGQHPDMLKYQQYDPLSFQGLNTY